MKTIQVFIASSEELKQERLAITELEMVLNNRLYKKGIELVVEKWEHLDSSMGIKDKQEEYNDVLRECDICIVLFWTKFGDFTKEEFEVAYQELLTGGRISKLFVLFKDEEVVTPELKAFKDGFAVNYGEFYTSFDSINTLKVHILLQLSSFCNDINLTMESDRISIDGVELVKLENNKGI